MKSTYLSRSLPSEPAVVVIIVLVIGNFLSNRIVPAAAYVPFNLLVTALVVIMAWDAVTAREMGMKDWWNGARWGLIVVGVGFCVYVLAAFMPGISGLFRDSRVDPGVLSLLYTILLRIPFGTVVLEEVAFRGVIPALFARSTSTFRAAAIASALFGLWHVLPSLEFADINPVFGWLVGDGLAGKVAGVAIAVFGTFLVGLFLCFLRFRSGSILAPIIAHIGSNSGGYLLAWLFGGGAISSSVDLG